MDLLNEISQAVVIGVGLAYAAHSLRQYRSERRTRIRQSPAYQRKLARAATLFAAEARCRVRQAETRDGVQLTRIVDRFGGVHYCMVKPLPLTAVVRPLAPTPTLPTPIRRAPVTRPLPVLVERVESLVTA